VLNGLPEIRPEVNVNRFLGWFVPVILLITVSGASLVTAQDSSDPEYLKAVTTIYAVSKVGAFVKDWCDDRAPQTKPITDRALAAWRTAFKLDQIELRFAALAGGRRAQIDASLEEKRDTTYENLDQNSSDPESDCQKLESYLNQQANPKTLYPNEYALAFSRPATNQAASGGANSSGGTTKPTNPSASPPPSSQSAAPQGTVYTVAQLSAIYEDAKRKTSGSLDAKIAAAERALKALSTIYVTGQPSDDTTLIYESVRGKSKIELNCVFKAETNFKTLGLIGKTIVVRGRVTDFGVRSADFEDCAVITNTSLLKKSGVSEDSGLNFSAAAFSAGVNKGIKPNQIDGVYLEQNTGFGVGGMVIIRYDPVLMLKDGWAYDGWMLTPADLDVNLSRKLEPQSWRRYERKGDQIRVQEQGGKWSKFEKWSQVGPAKPGDTLQGTFSSIGGGGNMAFGGSTMIAVVSAYTFKKDGTFSSDQAVSASGGNEATDPNGPPGVVATSQRSSSGTYRLDGYTLELRFSNGRVMRRAFLWFDAKDKDSIFIDGTAFLIEK
jgi:hypothetical protein